LITKAVVTNYLFEILTEIKTRTNCAVFLSAKKEPYVTLYGKPLLSRNELVGYLKTIAWPDVAYTYYN